MPEVSSTAAAKIIGSNHVTVREHVENGRLPGRRVGLRGVVRIEIDDLREFAKKYQYRFNEELAATLAQ